MKWRPKSFGEAVLPLETMSAIIGHGVFQYPPGRRHTLLSPIYAITVTSMYYVAVGFTLKLCFESLWYKNASQIFFRIFYSSAVISAIGQILSWCHARRFSDVMKKISKVDETLRELGATFDYTSTMKMGMASMILWILTCCTLNAIDVLWLFGLMPIEQILIVITVFHHPLNINSIVVLNFSTALRLVKMRFYKANKLLEKIATPVRRPINNQAWRYLGSKVCISTLTIPIQKNSKGAAYRQNVMEVIKHVHLELCKILKVLNRAYGVQVILEVTAYFVLMTGLLYDMYNVGTDPTAPRRYWRIIVHCIWCTTYLTKLVLINQACEAVSAEAHRTGNILHRMNGMIDDYEFLDEIEQFSLQIMYNRVVFSLAGLITLGWKFVHGFLGTVTTYLVILIQMHA